MYEFTYGTCRSDEYLYISESNAMQIDSVLESTALRINACEAFELTGNDILVESVMDKIKSGWDYVCKKIKDFYKWVLEILQRMKNWIIKKYNAAKEYLKNKFSKEKKEPVVASFDPSCSIGLSISMESGYEINDNVVVLKDVLDIYTDDGVYNKFRSMFNKLDGDSEKLLNKSDKAALKMLANDFKKDMQDANAREDAEEAYNAFLHADEVVKQVKAGIEAHTKDVTLDFSKIDISKFSVKEIDEFKAMIETCQKQIKKIIDKGEAMNRKAQDADKRMMKMFMVITRGTDKAMRPMINATLHSLNTYQKAICAYMKQDAMKMTSPEEA